MDMWYETSKVKKYKKGQFKETKQGKNHYTFMQTSITLPAGSRFKDGQEVVIVGKDDFEKIMSKKDEISTSRI